MSLKPAKRSDKNKEWMKPRRDSGIRISPEYHLLVTEGTKTEPLYFQRIKEIINSRYKERIQLVIRGEGDNPLNLFEKAYDKAKSDPNRFSHVWIIYDTDDFPAENIDKTALNCSNHSTDDTEFHAIWSNQCIELWFLLHFCFLQSDINRDQYYPKLSNNMHKIKKGDYCKNRPDMFDILLPHIDAAISNAKKLEEINDGKPPSKAAPGTMVHKIIEKLYPYFK